MVGLDFDSSVVARLQKGSAPLFEPGLDALLQEGLKSGRLSFSDSPAAACRDASILWVTHDTAVDEDDQSDVEGVLSAIRRAVAELPKGALVLLSSQLPVGTCRRLESELAGLGLRFACSPENLCLGEAVANFQHPDRVIIGYRDAAARVELEALFRPFSGNIVWMSPESAEMTKHSINSFLALSITFINEVARLCDATGADAKEVEAGLKSERRIGPRAYLSPSGAFSGGTLARDVATFINLGRACGEPLDVINAIRRSNDRHRQWVLEQVLRAFPDGPGRRIALLGLTYKPGTGTLRRSAAVDLARSLNASGFAVSACDPTQPQLPPDLGFVALAAGPGEAMDGADAVVVCTPWPEYLALDWPALVSRLRQPVVIDVGRFLQRALAGLPRLRYITIGSPS